MSDTTNRRSFSNRQFVAAIRDELDKAGRPDIAISRQWIDEDEPGFDFLVHAPIGTSLTVPLKVSDRFFHVQTCEDLKSHASEFATALFTLKRAERMLEKYARDVRAAATTAIAAARAQGLDILLEGVGFNPVYASHLGCGDWKDATFHVLASVNVRHTSFFLRPKTSDFLVEEPSDIANVLADLLEEQQERQDRIAELDALGADLIVDQITLDLLAAHGLDAEEVLRKVWKTQCVNLTVEHLGRECSLSLISSNGYATACIVLEDAIWNGEHLWFTGDEHLKDHTHLIGKSVGDLVRHPVFASRRIVDVFNRHADHVVFDMSDKVMFDADVGLLSREDRLAA